MTVSITIRKVPEEVRDELAARAKLAGRSLQEHLLAELIEMARKPSMEAWLARVRARKEATGTSVSSETIVRLIREDRDDPRR